MEQDSNVVGWKESRVGGLGCFKCIGLSSHNVKVSSLYQQKIMKYKYWYECGIISDVLLSVFLDYGYQV